MITTFTLDLNTGLTQVLADSTNTYLYGNGRIGQFAGVESAYFLGDALGSVRQLVDGSGAVTLAKSYEPYGEVLNSAGSGSSSYGFAGEVNDPMGLVYLRARYLQPDLGMFTQKDPSRQESNLYQYAKSNPANWIDPSGLYSIETIKKNLEGKQLSQVFGLEKYGVARWGLYALLKDANDFDRILLRTLDFSYEGIYSPLAPDPGGEWQVTSECDKLKFYNKQWGEVSLIRLLEIINLKADTRANLSDKWWRPSTLQFHWYQGKHLYSDYYNVTHTPDLYTVAFAPKALAGGSIGIIYDRYGNQYEYVSASFSLGGSIVEGWEGYATRNNTSRRWQDIPDEKTLSSTIIEGLSVGLTGSLGGFGGGIMGWRNGSIALFGGVNYNFGVFVSGGYTWRTGFDMKKRWHWIDSEIPAFGPQS